jgi:hypothetical protein
MRQNISWDIDHIFEPANDTDFNFQKLGITEYQLNNNEIIALISALNFNEYFKTLTMVDLKLEKDPFCALTTMFKLNSTLENINLNGVNTSYKG